MLRDAPDSLKAKLGWPTYVIAAAWHLCETPMQVSISLDDAPPITRRARTVLVGNVGRLRGGIWLLPEARPDDGLLDVAIVMPPERRSWLLLAWALIRHRRTGPMMETFQAKHVEISSDREHPRELDGDLIEPSRNLTAEVSPAALWVCVPRSDAGSSSYGATARNEDGHASGGVHPGNGIDPGRLVQVKGP